MVLLFINRSSLAAVTKDVSATCALYFGCIAFCKECLYKRKHVYTFRLMLNIFYCIIFPRIISIKSAL